MVVVAMGAEVSAARASLRRLQAKAEIATPHRGFYVT